MILLALLFAGAFIHNSTCAERTDYRILGPKRSFFSWCEKNISPVVVAGGTTWVLCGVVGWAGREIKDNPSNHVAQVICGVAGAGCILGTYMTCKMVNHVANQAAWRLRVLAEAAQSDQSNFEELQ